MIRIILPHVPLNPEKKTVCVLGVGVAGGVGPLENIEGTG